MRKSIVLLGLGIALCGLQTPMSSAYDWASFHGGASFSRESVEILGPPVSLAWKTSLQGGILSSPAISDGRIYVGTRTGHFYCVDATSGAVVWETLLGSRVDSSPALAHGHVYICTSDGQLFCLSATTGGMVWQKYHGGECMSSPLVAAGLVVIGVGSPSCDLRAYSEASGLEMWRYNTGQPIYSSPSYYRGVICCGTCTGQYFALDTAGQLLWSVSTPGGVLLSSPAMRYGRCFGFPGHADSKLYCWDVTTGGLLWSGNPAAPPTPGGSTPILDELFLQEVLAQAPADRQAFIAAWAGVRQDDLGAYQAAVAYAASYPGDDDDSFPVQTPFIAADHVKPSTPAVAADHVIWVQKGLGFPNPRFSVVCMQATTGLPQWWYQEQAPGDPIGCASSPAISMSQVFVGISSRLYTFDLHTGALQDTRTLDGEIYASPALGNGLVVTGTFKGSLYAFQTGNHAPAMPAGPYSPSGGGNITTSTPTLTWTPALDADAGHGTGAMRYLVEVDDDGELDWNCDAQYATPAGQASLTLAAVPNDASVVWRVRAVDTDGALSPWSALQTFTVNRSGAAVILQDARFLCAVPGDGQVTLVWQDPAAQVFDGWRILVQDEFGGQRTPIVLGRVETATVTGLSNFVQYTFRLVAYRLGGGESPGLPVSATPRPAVSIGNQGFSTLAEALAAAHAGDLVRLGVGVIISDSLKIPKGVSLAGAGPGYTILQGLAVDKPVLRVPSGTSGSPPAISMMTITHGSDGVFVEHGGRAVLKNLILTALGNGVRVENGGGIEVVNCTISDNTGHGVWIEGNEGKKQEVKEGKEEKADEEDSKKDKKDKEKKENEKKDKKEKDKGEKEDKVKGEEKKQEKEAEEEKSDESEKQVLRNNVITFNAGRGILGPASGAALISTFSDVFANAGGDFGGTASVGLGVISLDPRFTARTPSDYRVKPDSPCVDAGDPADAFDQEPAPNGGRVDMGAYGNTVFAWGGGAGAGVNAAAPGCFLASGHRVP